MNEKAKRNVEKIKELILPLEKENQQMILLCVDNISMVVVLKVMIIPELLIN